MLPRGCLKRKLATGLAQTSTTLRSPRVSSRRLNSLAKLAASSSSLSCRSPRVRNQSNGYIRPLPTPRLTSCSESSNGGHKSENTRVGDRKLVFAIFAPCRASLRPEYKVRSEYTVIHVSSHESRLAHLWQSGAASFDCFADVHLQRFA